MYVHIFVKVLFLPICHTGKRKAATTSPAGRRKRPRREAAEKSDLSIFDFED